MILEMFLEIGVVEIICFVKEVNFLVERIKLEVIILLMVFVILIIFLLIILIVLWVLF